MVKRKSKEWRKSHKLESVGREFKSLRGHHLKDSKMKTLLKKLLANADWPAITVLLVTGTLCGLVLWTLWSSI